MRKIIPKLVPKNNTKINIINGKMYFHGVCVFLPGLYRVHQWMQIPDMYAGFDVQPPSMDQVWHSHIIIYSMRVV